MWDNASIVTSLRTFRFPDENFSQRFIRKGDVAMFSRKPNGNGSMFLIALRPLTEENGRFVVFGTVVKGIELLSVVTQRFCCGLILLLSDGNDSIFRFDIFCLRFLLVSLQRTSIRTVVQWTLDVLQNL